MGYLFLPWLRNRICGNVGEFMGRDIGKMKRRGSWKAMHGVEIIAPEGENCKQGG
jgi:hypothetical protein